MDLGGLVRAVNAAFNDGAKLVTRIRDDRLETERALPEEPTRDLLDSLQLGPVLVKGQYDRDIRRFGEPFACGDGQAREQMKDVLINLQMALIISLRGVSMDDGDVDFESLQQTSDDCRTNAGVCLGQLSQRLSDTAKAQALISDAELMAMPPPKHASLAYSSSRSTRSTRSSGRDPRTPPDSIHENFASMSIASNTTTIRPHTQERKRSNSSASKRGYQPRRPTTPQSATSSRGMPTITIPRNGYEDGRGSRLRHAPSHEVLTPPDEDTLNSYHHGYLRHQPSHEQIAVARGSGGNLSESGYQSSSYAGRRQVVPSVASSRSNGSRTRQAHPPSSLAPAQVPPERSVSRAKFGGIPSDPVIHPSSHGHDRHFDMSALDDPTSSEDEDIISMRRPSSHALGIDEHPLMSPARPESPAQSFVVSLPDADHHEAPISPISPISEQHDSGHDSIPDSPEVLSSQRYLPHSQGERFDDDNMDDDNKVDVNDTTPTLGPGEFGYATVYETSRIKPVESMPRYDPPPRFRQPRQDSLSRLRESRQYGTNGTTVSASNGRTSQLRSPDAVNSTIQATENKIRHYRNRPSPADHQSTEPPRSKLEHVAYMQQDGRLPKQYADLPLPPPPRDPNRPGSRSSARSHHKPQQGYKVFPTTSNVARGAPLPPPNMAPPAPPTGPRWTDMAVARPSTSPAPPNDLSIVTSNTSFLRPTTSATTAADTDTIDALPQGEPGPATSTTSEPPAESSSSDSEPAKPPPKQVKMVRIVPLDMAMYGYTAPSGPPKPKKPKPTAPPMPLTLPLTLPTEKHLQGFCKGGFKVFVNQPAKGFSASTRPAGTSSNVPLWQCGKCHFQGPLKTVSVERRIGKRKEEKIFDPKVRNSPVKGVDGQTGGVRYKWVFLAKCHVPLKSHVDWLVEAKRAARGEVGGFGCIFCCAEGQSRGWEGSAFNHMHNNGGDGGSVKSSSTGASGKTTDSGSALHTPIFKDLLSFLEHLEMHRVGSGAPGPEMLGRMKAVCGRVAGESEQWEVNFLPLRGDVPPSSAGTGAEGKSIVSTSS